MSKTLARSSSSSVVRRSKSSVAKPASLSASATWRLRGLSRLEPLPWAKITRPAAGSGSRRSPARRRPGASSISTGALGGRRVRRGRGSAAAAQLCRARGPPPTARSPPRRRPVRSRRRTGRCRRSRGAGRGRRPRRSRRRGAPRCPVERPARRGPPCAAPRAFSACPAATAVPPVAIPSSTRITVRPSTGSGSRSPR